MSGITRDEWLAALDKVNRPVLDADPAALTVREFAALLGIGVDAARERLNRLVLAGLAVRVSKQYRDTTGAIQRAPAYRLENKPMTDELDVEPRGETLDGADPLDDDDPGRAERNDLVQARRPKTPRRRRGHDRENPRRDR